MGVLVGSPLHFFSFQVYGIILERLLNLLTRNEKPEGFLYSSLRWHSVMRNAKPQCFHVSGKNFTGNEKFQGNIYLKPEESPEDRWFCVVNNMMSPYDLYEILSGFWFLVSKFSNLSKKAFFHLLISHFLQWYTSLLGILFSFFLPYTWCM